MEFDTVFSLCILSIAQDFNLFVLKVCIVYAYLIIANFYPGDQMFKLICTVKLIVKNVV